ncbi:hypothetical protein [Streptomyces sp. NPDC051183]|uniref:LppU/SCO3897 family protein n=1 Tax=Streptomyces sp. NPDC051183 TaxID=3155165 RepID=UPI00341BF2F6
MTTLRAIPVVPRKGNSRRRLVACGLVGGIIAVGSIGTAAGTATAVSGRPVHALPTVETPTPEAPEPSPYGEGTCLDGTLPDSTTPAPVSNKEVPCSSPDAHYLVIQRISNTTDLDRCEDNPRSEYKFSYSYTVGGVPVKQYVYCLVGLGSYARP